MDKDNKNTFIHKSLWKNGYIIAAIIISFISLAFYLVNINNWWSFQYLKDSDNSFTAGLATVGDYFGGVLNPVLTFITIILLIRSIELQRADFRTQLKEQEEQKKEFERQSAAQEEQVNILKTAQHIEAFERNFFSLLEQNNQFLQQQNFKNEVNDLYKKLMNELNGDLNPLYIKNLDNIISDYNEINAYTRFLYRCLSYLSNKKNDTSNQIDVQYYARLLRSVISNKLLYILMMNGVRDESIANFSKYRLLLDEFNFLEHVVLKKIEEVARRNLQIFASFSRLTIHFKENRTEELLALNSSDLEKIIVFNLYLKYSPEAFDKNPHYIEKILPIINFFIENKIIEKEYWKK